MVNGPDAEVVLKPPSEAKPVFLRRQIVLRQQRKSIRPVIYLFIRFVSPLAVF
jgi:hypothetical protein